MTTMSGLNLSLLDGDYSVCRLDSKATPPPWATQGNFYSVSHSAEELSVVCESGLVPTATKAEHGWKVLKVAGPLDFNLTGILVELTNPLAQAGIPVFAISTFDTDYLLVRAADLNGAMTVLTDAGHTCSR